MFYTYAHSKPEGKIFYIGKGQGKRAWDKTSRNPHWHNIVNKYGFNAQVLAEWETEKEALEHEVFLIACFKDMGYELANMTDGGEGTSGYKYTEEQLENRRGENNGMFGRKRTLNELNNISEGTKKGMGSKEVLEKLKKANAKENNPNFGKVACNAKKVLVEGMLFTSQTAAAKHLKMSLTNFIRKVKAGKIVCQYI